MGSISTTASGDHAKAAETMGGTIPLTPSRLMLGILSCGMKKVGQLFIWGKATCVVLYMVACALSECISWSAMSTHRHRP